MAKFGCPPRFIAVVRQLHDDKQAHVQIDGELSEHFGATNGIKQGCVMAPILFSMVFLFYMLMDAFQDSDTGFPIRYRFDDNIFNLRLQTKTDVLDEILYADDMDKNASSEAKCREPWIKSHSHVITMVSQSAQKRQRLYTNQHLENRTMN